jgi:hypothetical protein
VAAFTFAGYLPPSAHLINVLSVAGIGLMMWWSSLPNRQRIANFYFYASEGEGLALLATALVVLHFYRA